MQIELEGSNRIRLSVKLWVEINSSQENHVGNDQLELK